MEPSPEALAWQRRADAWAQQAEPEQSQAVEPVSRWSEVASTGRPAFPADGVGWRTETAEWRATGARWRQTTEWRSTTGSHGWRSTTEAWRTGGDSEFVPPATTPAAQPAISSTAWATPSDAAATESARDAAQSWQQPDDPRPTWQQFADQPSWQQPASPTQPAQPSWQQPSPRQPAESSPSWQQLVDPTSAGSTPSWRDTPARETPSWNAPAQDVPSWDSSAPASSTPSWQRGSIEGSATWTDAGANGSAGDGRRRGEPTDTPSWQRGETPSWQRSETPSWQRSETPSSQRSETPSSQRSETPSWQRSETPSWQRAEAPSWQTPRDDGRHLVREDDRAAWRRDADLGQGSRPGGRRRATEPGTHTSGGTGWATRSEADNWAGHTDTGSIQLFPDPATPETPTWGARAGAPSAPEQANPTRGYADPPGRRALPAAPYDDDATRRVNPADYRDTPAGGRHEGSGGHRALPTTPYEETQRPGSPYDDSSRTARRYADGLADLAGPGNPASAPGRPAGERRADRGSRYGTADRGYQPDDRTSAAPSSGFVADDRGAAAPAPGFAADARAARYPVDDRPAPAPTSGYARGGPIVPPREQDDQRYVDGPRGAAAPGRYADHVRDDEPTTPFGLEDRRAQDPDGRTGEPRRRPGRPSRRERYNQVSDDWREHTGSWEAEPDTSSWARDPDTGQWSRSEDDPRVRAWREEAARRDAAQHSPAAPRRELPAAPADARRLDDGRQPDDGRRPADETAVRGGWQQPEPDSRPSRGGGGRAGVMPSSALPSGALPSSAIPDAAPRRGMADDTAPWRGMPDDTDSRRGMRDDGAPRRGTPDDTASWRGTRDETAPRRGMPGEIVPRRGMPDGPVPRSGMPDGGSHLRGAADPMPRRGLADGPRPRSAMPDDATHLYGGLDDTMPRGGMPDGPLPRSGAPGIAPRSAMPRGGVPDVAPRSGMPAISPRRALPSGGGPSSGIPGPTRGDTSQYGDDVYRGASYRDDPYRDEEPYDDGRPAGGRRRAVVEDPPAVGRRRAAAEPAVGEEPLSPEAWRRSLESSQGRQPSGADDRDDWRGGGAGAVQGYDELPARDSDRDPRQRAEPGGWQVAERAEASRGSATYRGGGTDDWRRDLADESDLAEGESRRYGTADYAPFRSSGSAAVPRPSNLSMTSTSLLMPAGGPDTATGRPQRASNGWLGPSGSYERRPVGSGFSTGRKSDLLDPDDEEDEQVSGGPLAAVGYTVIWYGVPIVLFVFYMLVVNSGAQTHALDTLAKAAPQFGISLVLSVVVAVGLRWVSSSWKAVSVGLAAAVVGGGLATVISSAITGNSLS